MRQFFQVDKFASFVASGQVNNPRDSVDSSIPFYTLVICSLLIVLFMSVGARGSHSAEDKYFGKILFRQSTHSLQLVHRPSQIIS